MIVVIEDDALAADTLKLYLEQAGFEVATARDGLSGLALAAAPDTTLVVLDLMIAGISGQDVCRRLRAVSTVPIIMVTARVAEADRIAGLELGADDYVPKPFSPREVVARVHALLRRTGRRGDGDAPQTIAVGDLEIDVWSRQARVAGKPVSLTPTEYRLLEALARQPGRVFTRDELVARAFGPDYTGYDRTVDVHITNLRRKIEAGRDPRYLLTVHGVGYKLAGPERNRRDGGGGD
jgi:two-component system, OmpR family, alkaline phosphatase synthesis response regulator PhoP